MYDEIDPARTALVVVDLDLGSCAREPELAEAAIVNVNALARRLRSAGGVVAFATSRVVSQAHLARFLGDESASAYYDETQPGGIGTVLASSLEITDDDLHAVKLGASAFFPGRCDLHDQLEAAAVDALFIAGLVTNVCCESSARDACELGYRVTMISDACVGHSFGLHEASLSTFFRVFGDVRTTDDAIALIESSQAAMPARSTQA